MEHTMGTKIGGGLLIIGGLNWGLIGLAGLGGLGNLNVVNLLLGSIPALENVVYLVVGLAALYMAYSMMKQ